MGEEVTETRNYPGGLSANDVALKVTDGSYAIVHRTQKIDYVGEDEIMFVNKAGLYNLSGNDAVISIEEYQRINKSNLDPDDIAMVDAVLEIVNGDNTRLEEENIGSITGANIIGILSDKRDHPFREISESAEVMNVKMHRIQLLILEKLINDFGIDPLIRNADSVAILMNTIPETGDPEWMKKLTGGLEELFNEKYGK